MKSLAESKLFNFLFGVIAGSLLIWYFFFVGENSLPNKIIEKYYLSFFSNNFGFGSLWVLVLFVIFSLVPYFGFHLFNKTYWNKNLIIYLLGVILVSIAFLLIVSLSNLHLI